MGYYSFVSNKVNVLMILFWVRKVLRKAIKNFLRSFKTEENNNGSILLWQVSEAAVRSFMCNLTLFFLVLHF